MGRMCHHTIVVTSWNEDLIRRARAEAQQLFDAGVSEVVPGAINGYNSFFVAPDGSKEGWDESDRGDAARRTFIDWCEAQRYEDHSTPLDYVEVRFSDEGGWDDRILASSARDQVKSG